MWGIGRTVLDGSWVRCGVVKGFGQFGLPLFERVELDAWPRLLTCSLPSTRPCTMDFVRAVRKQFVLISDQMGRGRCSGRRHAKRE